MTTKYYHNYPFKLIVEIVNDECVRRIGHSCATDHFRLFQSQFVSFKKPPQPRVARLAIFKLINH